MTIFIQNKVCAQYAQISNDTIYNTNIFKTNLYNDANSAYLGSVLNYNNSYNRLGITVNNNYLSNVSKLNQNFYRDYNNLNLTVYYNVKNNFSAGAGVQNVFFTDGKNTETNKNNSNYIFADLNYSLFNKILINSRLGYKAEDQIGEFNTGFSGIINATADNLYFDEYLTNGNITLFYEDLMQKQNHNYEISASISKRFGSQTDNTGNISYYNQLNDFYSPATPSVAELYNVKNNIERRQENYFQIGDVLNYSLNNNLIFSFSGFFINRDITKEYQYRAAPSNIIFENVYDSKVVQSNLEINAGINYSRENFLSQFNLIISERSENHSLINTTGYTPSQILELEKSEKNKNNNSTRASALLNIVYNLSNTNSVGFTGSTSLLKYDTDFQLNYDDRDESETVLSAYHQYNNLINFNVQTRFDILLSGLNYIYSQRSANNFNNRIYKLTSVSSFNPVSKINTRNVVQVLANYTVYDFEDIVSQVQSFSYRQLYIMDSTTFNVFPDFYFDFNAELKIYEQGQFNDDNFLVKPIAYFSEQLLAPNINYMFDYFINAGIGYKFFQQLRYRYDNGEKVLTNTYQTYGPFGRIILYLNKNSVINLIAGLDNIVFDDPLQNNSALNLQINVLWNM
ncbi:MAG TPA: hypothetical protein PKA90_04745 [Ignavibacteria bacterium]|nr:hypothetical protein [Ignavibacteria bacterium]HMR39716.1 hypothetical protein [Ignavibacteria bacterium]